MAAAPTGSGKSAAYVLPILQSFSASKRKRKDAPEILVLVPTRELASQVSSVFETLSSELHHVPQVLTVYGGVQAHGRYNPRDIRIIVATPGRLLDMVASGSINIGGIKKLVIDEADRLLSPAFYREVHEVLAAIGVTPHSTNEHQDKEIAARPQVILVSATFPDAALKRADELLNADSVRVDVRPANREINNSTGDTNRPPIDHRVIEVEAAHRKFHLLLALLKHRGRPPAPQGVCAIGPIRKASSFREHNPTSRASLLSRTNKFDVEAFQNDEKVNQLQDINIGALKDLCHEKGLSTSGSRTRLLARLSLEDKKTTEAAPIFMSTVETHMESKERPDFCESSSKITDVDEEGEDFDGTEEDWSRVLVFAATQRGAQDLAGKLCRAGVPSEALHGGQSQQQRESALAALKSSKVFKNNRAP